PLFPSVSEEISVQIKTPYFPIPRSLWPSLTKKIMEGLDLKQSYTNSAHRVCRLQYGIYDLHFKQTPSNPLMEYAIHSFASRIAGEYTPCTTLVRFDVEQQGKKKSYPVLISQTIPGKNLKTVWPKATPNRSYTWNLLIAILTKPQDGRLSNYVLHEQDLFCIDNDLAFVEPVTKFGPFRTVHFSAAPFCLFPLSTPLDQEVLEEFIALDSVSICKAWVEEIINKEKEYVDLFTESERKDLYEKQQCTLNLLLQKGTFSTLNLQFWQLQNTIQAAINQDKAFTAGDLLQELVSLTEEKVGNYVYRAYNNTKATPEEKQQTALERKQDSSVTAVEYHKNCLGKIPCFNETGVLKKYSLQEASQELFHAFLIESEHTFWKNSAGKSALGANFKALQNPKREAKILLSINELIKRSSQKVLSLSFYYSTLLDKRKIEFLLHSALEKVDLRHCSNVDNDTVWLIQEKCPHLKELILIECPKVTDLGEPLLSSRLSFNNLETLEITHTPCINLAFRAPKLRFLNVSHNPELVDLDFEAPSLLEINAKKSTKIRLSPLAKKHTLEALAQIPKNLVTAPFELINNRQIVTDIILQNGLVLEHATIQFKKDKEIVLAAVQQNGLAFQYAAQELKSDRDIVFTAVKRSGLALQYAAEELKNDKEIVLIAVKENELAFEYASEKLKSDREFVLAAIQQNGRALEYAAEELKSDQKFMLAAVQWHGYALQYASETLKNDRKIVLAAVRQNGKAFQYAAKQLKNDREFILIAIKQSCEAFQYASVELKSDKEFMLAAMNQESNVLQYTSEELKSDRDIVLAGVQKNGLALQYAIEEFKSDRKIVLAAVQKNRLALEYAAEEVKSDRDIVLAAVQKNGLALESASKGLKSDKEFMLAAMQENRYALEYASEELKNDRDFMLGACLLKGEALQFASKELKSDKEFMLAAVKKNGLNLQYASAEFKSDREVVLAAMRQNGEALEYTSAEFKSDREIVLAAVMQNPQVFSYASKNLKSDQKFVLDATLESKTLKFNKKFMVVAVQENGYALEYASETLKSNKQLVLTAVQQNGLALQYAAEELKSDREIVLAAVQQNGLALQYAAEELKSDREIALAAVQKNRLAIEDVSKALKSDGKFMLSAALQNKEAFQYAAEELKSDKGFILAAVKQDGNALQYAAEEL
ncbi:MAG: DUF4116 domain-containing protein, partial [Parachlamydiaceae bacterium]